MPHRARPAPDGVDPRTLRSDGAAASPSIPRPRAAEFMLLPLMVLVAVGLRVWFVFRDVFQDRGICLQGVDPWYHLRLIDNLVHNFPRPILFDPYGLHPGGQHIAVGPMLDLMVASISLMLGWGSPSDAFTHSVAAWLPPILGGCTVVVVWLIGRSLFGPIVGLLATAMLAVIPGPFLQRSMLGYADHHVAESLFSALCACLVILAAEAGAAGSERGFRANRRTLILSLCAGVSLGCYLLSWIGGSFFVAVLFGWFVLQLIFDHLTGRRTGYLLLIGLPLFLLPVAMVAPYVGRVDYFQYHAGALVGSAAGLLTLAGMSVALGHIGARRFWYPVAVAGLLLIGATAFDLVAGSVWSGATAMLRRFTQGSDALVEEVASLLRADGRWSLEPLWNTFAAGAVLAPIGLLMLGRMVWRERSPGKALLLVWSGILLLACLRQRRFAYYGAVNAALLSGLVGGTLIQALVRWKPRGRQPVLKLVTGTAVLLVCLLPSLGPAMDIARTHTGPHPDWYEAMNWLRQNTPEPFGDAAIYRAPFGGSVDEVARRSSYGVMCPWDRGYWVLALGRRVPNANPTQAGAGEAARYFVAQDEGEASRILDELDSRYVVVDYSLPIWRAEDGRLSVGKFAGQARWAGHNPEEFFETYYRRGAGGGFVPDKTLFYPAYYRSMAVRLFTLGGEAFEPQDSSFAVLFREHALSGSGLVKELLDLREFPAIQEAQAFLDGEPEGRWRLVGTSPFASCVPLQTLRRHRLVHQSPTVVAWRGDEPISCVEVFEYERAD